MKPVYLLAFLSGAAALIYEVAWSKMLALTFGSTTLAASAVVAGFIGGMGLGAVSYGPLARIVGKGLGGYAIVELGIAISAAAITTVIYWLPGFYASVAPVIGGGYAATLWRFIGAFLLLLVPSALMGVTYPFLCASVLRSWPSLGAHLGTIYGVNTLGAAAGAVLGGIVLLESFGGTASTYCANGLNVAAAAVAMVLARRERGCGPAQQESEDPSRAAHESDEIGDGARLPRTWIAVVLFFSGATTLAYEMLWFRALKYVVGNSTYALAIVLVVFLVGLGFGGLLYRRVVSVFGASLGLGLCQLAIAAAALIAMGLEAYALRSPALSPYVSEVVGAVSSLPWAPRIGWYFFLATAVMLPPTIFMGISFPLCNALFVANIRRVGQHLGWAVLLANVGSIAGAIGGAVILLPLLGTANGTRWLAIGNFALGAATLLIAGPVSRAMRGVIPGTAVVGALWLVVPSAISVRAEGEQPDSVVRYWREGDMSTVKVFDVPGRGTRMAIDGYVIASSMDSPDNIGFKHQLLAHLAMALRPEASRTLTVGLGSGASMHALAAYDGVRTLDCVEISRQVVEGAACFREGAVLNDPRSHLVVDDAIHFLLREPSRYDLIVSDGKQNSRYSGNSPLLSTEFYRLCLARLSPNGIMIQWMPTGIAPRGFGVTLRTFCGAFDHARIYFFPPLHMLMVGSVSALSRPGGGPAALHEAARAALGPYGIETSFDLLASEVADGSAALAAAGEGPRNTWDAPVLEFLEFKIQPRSVFEFYRDNLLLLNRAAAARDAEAGSSNSNWGDALASARMIREGYLATMAGDLQGAARLFVRAEQLAPGSGTAKKLVRLSRRAIQSNDPTVLMEPAKPVD